MQPMMVSAGVSGTTLGCEIISRLTSKVFYMCLPNWLGELPTIQESEDTFGGSIRGVILRGGSRQLRFVTGHLCLDLIVSTRRDVHARHLAQKLKEAGHEYAFLPTALCAKNSKVTLRPSQGRNWARLCVDEDHEIESAEIHSVWYRRPSGVEVPS